MDGSKRRQSLSKLATDGELISLFPALKTLYEGDLTYVGEPDQLSALLCIVVLCFALFRIVGVDRQATMPSVFVCGFSFLYPCECTQVHNQKIQGKTHKASLDRFSLLAGKSGQVSGNESLKPSSSRLLRLLPSSWPLSRSGLLLCGCNY